MTKVDSELVEGFAAVPRWIMRTMDLTAHELAVLLVLAGRVNASGLCWPSHETIADEAGCGEKTVRRALGSLRDKNLVTWRQQVRDDGGVATNMYVLHLDAPIAASDPSVTGTGPLGQGDRRSNYIEVTKDKYIYMSDESDVADPQPRKQKRTKRAYSDEFEKFWKIYPRTKDGKFPASKAFTKALKVADLDTILTGAQQYRDDPNRVDAYTKMATTWLNQRCWEDGPLPPRGGRVTMMDRLRGEYDTLMPQPEQPQLRQIEGGQQW